MLYFDKVNDHKSAVILSIFFIAISFICPVDGNSFDRDKADENFYRIQKEFYRLVKKDEIRIKLREACAKGNDNACFEVKVDVNDPCRRYLVMKKQLLSCRMQQCNDGNQEVCNILRRQNKRMKVLENENEANKIKLNKIRCESNCHSDNVTCGKVCSFGSNSNCRTECSSEYRKCKNECD